MKLLKAIGITIVILLVIFAFIFSIILLDRIYFGLGIILPAAVIIVAVFILVYTLIDD